jgi:hypothetical protein
VCWVRDCCHRMDSEASQYSYWRLSLLEYDVMLICDLLPVYWGGCYNCSKPTREKVLWVKSYINPAKDKEHRQGWQSALEQVMKISVTQVLKESKKPTDKDKQQQYSSLWGQQIQTLLLPYLLNLVIFIFKIMKILPSYSQYIFFC